MECFQVVESGEGIEGAILRGLAARGSLTGQCSDRHPALVVVSPRAVLEGKKLPQACRTVLLPGNGGDLLKDLRAASAVSYGPSPRDSLTISSREEKRMWATLQREVVTLEGRVVERQDFAIPLVRRGEEMPALATAGALLLLGVPPEEIGNRDIWQPE